MPEDNHRIDRIIEALWGGPRGQGLVWAVQENTKSIAALRDQINELRLLLRGKGGKDNGGLVSEIEKNSSARRAVTRLVWIVGAGVAGEFAWLLWWVVGQVASGG